MDLDCGSMLGKKRDRGNNLSCKDAIKMMNKNVTFDERKVSPKLKKVLDILGHKQCNVKLEKLQLNKNCANTSMKTSNFDLKSKKSVKYTDTEVDFKKPSMYDSSFTSGPSKDIRKVENTFDYANNLPSRVGPFEITVNGTTLNQLTHRFDQNSSDSVNINPGKLITKERTCPEKFPRPLSPEVVIKTFEKPSSINKRKQRTPVKADLKGHVGSPTNDIETPCRNISSSKYTGQNLDDIIQFSSGEQTRIQQRTTGNTVKKNSHFTSSDHNFLSSSGSKASEDFIMSKYNVDTKSTKRKLPASKIIDSERLSKKQRKKMVKFDPNISEVFKHLTNEEMIKGSNTNLSTEISGNDLLDASMFKLLNSRNVQVTYQKPKASKPSLLKLPGSKKNSRSLRKSWNNGKSLSLEEEEKEGTEREHETFSPDSSLHNSSNKLDSKSDSNILNNVYNNDKNLSDSEVLKKNGKFAIARMKTAKVPAKSILKKRALLAKPKSNKGLSSTPIEKLQQHELENNVIIYDKTSLLSNEEKSLSEKASSDTTGNWLSNVSSNQSQLLQEVSPTTTTRRKKKVIPSKPINRRGRPKGKRTKPQPSRPRKYSKKSPKNDLNFSTDTSENVVDSGSDSDMPTIFFQNSEAKADKNVSDSENLLPGFNEVLKNAKDKKRRGRGRKKKKTGRSKSIKVKDDVDADSSFVEDDDEEEQVISATAQSPAKRKHQKRHGRRYSVTGNWYIASGYLNDIMSLLEEFENCDGWRFKDFAKCWQKKSFSLVFRGRQTFKELLEFSEEIALLTMRFIGPSHSTKRRVGALYTLYGLYYKFPVGHFFNLRFELEEYKNLLELVHPFRSNVENPDPAFIFRKLELKGAILHCATAYEPCYDFHNEDRDLVDLEYGKQKLAKSSAVNIAVPKIQLDADSELLTYYHAVKAKLTGKGTEPEPERALSLISSEFLQTIFTDLSEMRKRTICELGMTAKSTINSSTQDGEISNQGNWPAAVTLPVDAAIARDAEKIINKAVNTPTVVQKSQEFYTNIVLLRDKSVNDFMRKPRSNFFNKPLDLKVRKDFTDDDRSPLNLTLPDWVSDVKNHQRVSTRENYNRRKAKKSINAKVTLSDGGSGKVVKFIELPLSRREFQDVKVDPFKFNNLKAQCKSIILESCIQEDYAMYHVQDIFLYKGEGLKENEILNKHASNLQKSSDHCHPSSKCDLPSADTHHDSLPLSVDMHDITIKEEHFEYDIVPGLGKFPSKIDYSKLNRNSSGSERSREKIMSGENLVVQPREGHFELLEDDEISQERGKSKQELSNRGKKNIKNILDSNVCVANHLEGNRGSTNFLIMEESPMEKLSPRKRGRPRGNRKLSVTGDNSIDNLFKEDPPSGREMGSSHENPSPRKRGRPRGKRKLSVNGDNSIDNLFKEDPPSGREMVPSHENPAPRKRGRPRGKKKLSTSKDSVVGEYLIDEDYDDDRLHPSKNVENGASDGDYSPSKMESFKRKKKHRVSTFAGGDNETRKCKNKRANSINLIPVKVGDQIKYQYVHGVSNNTDRFLCSKEIKKKNIKNRSSPRFDINDDLDNHLFFSPKRRKEMSLSSVQPDVNVSRQYINSGNKIPPINSTGQYYFDCYDKVIYKPHCEGYNYSPETPEISNETVVGEAAIDNLNDCQTTVLNDVEFDTSLNKDEVQLEINEESVSDQKEHHSSKKFVNSFVATTQEQLANTIKELSADWSDDESMEVSQSNDSYYEEALFPADQIIDVASLKKESGNENSQFSVSGECNLIGLNTQTCQEGNLFCKVMSTDGCSVFIPASIMSQVNSNVIEILSVKSVELDICPVTETLENLQLESKHDFIDKSDTSGPLYSHDTSVSQSKKISYSQMSNFQSQELFESKPLTSVPTTSEIFSKIQSDYPIPIPSSSGTPMRSFQKPLKPPSIAASSPSCSFLFSSKLKSLSNKKLASGRPPSPTPKPLVKFLLKGKNWSKKN